MPKHTTRPIDQDAGLVSLQGLEQPRIPFLPWGRLTPLSELRCPSELQQHGTGSIWPSPIHLQPLPPARKLVSGSWRLPDAALSGLEIEPKATVSRGLSLSLRVLILGASRRPARFRRTAPFNKTPLMRSSAPSAHQARRIHQRGVPHPLCSAFAVAPALTVSSPPDPAGLFRPAALLGFQDRTRHVHDSLGSPGPSGDDPHQLRPLRRPLARPRPCVAVSPGLASLAVA